MPPARCKACSVTVLETSASATTGSDGKANIAIATGAPVTLKFSKGGYADQFKSVRLQSGASGLQVAVRMLAREDALTLADAAAGGTLSGKQGATLVVPAGALVDAAGNAVSGAVQVAITPVDVAADVRAFPGLFQGLRASGARGLIESYGTVEYVLTKNGAPLQVAPGQKVTIEIPIYTGLHRDGSAVAAGQVIPLWSLDERTAAWVQEGTGTVVASAASPSGFALRAQVSHLSWWNCDQWLGSIPDGSYNPDVRCCIRDTPNGPCKENSGDICEHTGSGPSSGGSAGGNAGGRAGAALQRALREQPRQAPGAQRVPAVAAFATAPAITGAVLPMPADMDITLQSSARNGTYRGTRVLRGGAGVSEVVTVSVLPVASGGNDDPITLPWSQNYAMQSNGEVDRYKLTMPAGPGFEVYRVARRLQPRRHAEGHAPRRQRGRDAELRRQRGLRRRGHGGQRRRLHDRGQRRQQRAGGLQARGGELRQLQQRAGADAAVRRHGRPRAQSVALLRRLAGGRRGDPHRPNRPAQQRGGLGVAVDSARRAADRRARLPGLRADGQRRRGRRQLPPAGDQHDAEHRQAGDDHHQARGAGRARGAGHTHGDRPRPRLGGPAVPAEAACRRPVPGVARRRQLAGRRADRARRHEPSPPAARRAAVRT